MPLLLLYSAKFEVAKKDGFRRNVRTAEGTTKREDPKRRKDDDEGHLEDD